MACYNDYDDYDAYDYGDEYNNYDDDERETFYALTDGMYGDYEDFVDGGGDIDRLMDALGY